MINLNEIKNFKNLLIKKENFFFGTIILTIFFLDRVTKLKVLRDFSDLTYYINDNLNIDLIWNIGIGFGFLSTESTIVYNFITIIIGLVVIVLVYFFMFANKSDKLIYSLILGGACGNLYDRLTIKAVPDFIDIHYNNFHWFTFNVADIFITIGILIFMIKSFIYDYKGN